MREYIAWILVGVFLSISSFFGGMYYCDRVLHAKSRIEDKVRDHDGRITALETIQKIIKK
jgi:hypothetical protein